MTFMEQLLRRQQEVASHVCAGVDPDTKKMPRGRTGGVIGHGPITKRLLDFSLGYLWSVKDQSCIVKPNLAFWSCEGAENALAALIYHAHHHGLQVILDAKYGDIGNTAQYYAQTAFDRYGADAVTVNAYLGTDTLEPWLDYGPDKCIYVLCHTSNRGAAEFQEQRLTPSERQLFVHLAARATAKQKSSCTQIGLVMGATFPDQLALLDGVVPFETTPLLIPGVGSQKGDLVATVAHARRYLFVINSSSGLMHASQKSSDCAEVAGQKADDLRQQINKALAS